MTEREVSDSMVERVARASFAWWKEQNSRVAEFEDMNSDELSFALEHARVVIAALREPTDAMKSCHEEVHWDFSCHVCGGLTDGWHKMIDKALEPNVGLEMSAHCKSLLATVFKESSPRALLAKRHL
jgi:hypothetical protein